MEQAPQGCKQWGELIERLEDESEPGLVLQGLFLESIFLAANARRLFEQAWPVLIANDGRLLNQLLDRFIIVATLPDSQLLKEIATTPELAARLEHAFRLPYWPYWGPVLETLRAHCAEVVQIAPVSAARVCSLWLRTMPIEFAPGRPLRWRREAAEVALAIAREVQARKAEGIYFSDDEDQQAYEAAMYAAPDMPDEIAILCLELSNRREPVPEIRERADRARQKNDEESRRWDAADPEHARAVRQLCTPLLPLGPLREPWPDGPRERVDGAFQKVCLDTLAFPYLTRVRPNEALEILLAVCIEEPQDEDLLGITHRENCGIDYWEDGSPPFYHRGPFLQFLRESPEQGLSFVIRLVNFATKRYVETEPRRLARVGLTDAQPDLGVAISIDGCSRRWSGDARTFRWHHDAHCGAKILPCALMALERWLHEQLDQGVDIEPWVKRILAESESIAFAGLLIAIGKRTPSLFAGVLRPLLRAWELFDLDAHVTRERLTMNAGLLGWRLQSPKLISLAQEWFGQTHRKRTMRDIVIDLMLTNDELHTFLAEIRAEWRKYLDENGQPEKLQLLIEWLNPQNVTARPLGNDMVEIGIALPDEIRQRNEAELRHLEQRSQLITFPFQCRQHLDRGNPLSSEELNSFWETLQKIADDGPAPPTEMGIAIWRNEDVVCSGIAVLLVLHRDWLGEDATRMEWCRQKLGEVIRNPPPLSPFDINPNAGGNFSWDAFAAECGIVLLTENRQDPLARELVALGIVGYRITTTGFTMSRAWRCRERLGSDFDRMLVLAIRWAGVRNLLEQASQLQFETEHWFGRQEELIQAFIDGHLPPERPMLQEVNAEALADLDDLRVRRSPDRKVRRRRRRMHTPAVSDDEAIRPEVPGLDLQVLAAACSWLDLRYANCADERRKWLALIHELLTLSLSLLPHNDDVDAPEIDGLPESYDDWVFGLVARAIPQMTEAEDPDSLWKPILDLGTPAHEWIERFFWDWFSEGARAAETPQAFTTPWTRMICYALPNSHWDPELRRTYHLDDMVYELLGFHFSMNIIVDDVTFAKMLGEMKDTFAQVAQRWFGMTRVVNGFAQFVIRPANVHLLVPGIRWLSTAFQAFVASDRSSSDLEKNLVVVLNASWERERIRVAGDPTVRAAFQSLLTSLAARGSHAAIALRDRVLDSIGATT